MCGSGLKAAALAAQAVRAGDARAVVAGGMENMSAAPHLLPAMRAGARMGDAAAVDPMIHDGLWCASCDVHMGVTAENVATEDEITREDQDAFALESQRRAAAAIDVVELNEAFAAQSLAVVRRLGIDPARTNVHGGAIALGHPIGASGARVPTTLLHEMERSDLRLELAALCIGGGQGIAMVVEQAAG